MIMDLESSGAALTTDTVNAKIMQEIQTINEAKSTNKKVAFLTQKLVKNSIKMQRARSVIFVTNLGICRCKNKKGKPTRNNRRS